MSIEQMMHGLEARMVRELAQTRSAVADVLASGSGSASQIVFLPDDSNHLCTACGREFAPLRFAVHSRACGRARELPGPKLVAAQRKADTVRHEARALLERCANVVSGEVRGGSPESAKPVAARSQRPSAPSGRAAASQPGSRPSATASNPRSRSHEAPPPPVVVPDDMSTRRTSRHVQDEAWYQEELAQLEAEENEAQLERHRQAGRSARRPSADVCQPVEADDCPPAEAEDVVVVAKPRARTPVQKQLFDRQPAAKRDSRAPSPPPRDSSPPPRESSPPPRDSPPRDQSPESDQRSEYPTGTSSAFNAEALPEDAFVDDAEVPKATCSICNRNFNEDRLERHMKICEKQAAKKRKVFGESAARLKLQEKNAAEAAKLAEAKAAKKALWRQQSEAFQHAMKAASAVGNGEAAPPPPAEPEDSRTPCPHCGRKFEAAVAERHIPKCAQTKAKPNAVGAAMKRPSAAGGGRVTPSKAPDSGLATPTKGPPKEVKAPAEAKLNPRQLIEAKKAAEKAAESPSKFKAKKAPPRKTSPLVR